MATAVAVLNNFGTDNWNAELYESLFMAARLSIVIKSVKTHRQNLKVSYLLWRINGRTAKFFQEVDDIFAGQVRPSEEDAEPVTPERIQKAIMDLMQIGMSLNNIYEEARRKKLLNNSLIAGPITALRANADQFFELAELCNMMLDTNRVEQVFASANEQRSRGEVYDLSEV